MNYLIQSSLPILIYKWKGLSLGTTIPMCKKQWAPLPVKNLLDQKFNTKTQLNKLQLNLNALAVTFSSSCFQACTTIARGLDLLSPSLFLMPPIAVSQMTRITDAQ